MLPVQFVLGFDKKKKKVFKIKKQAVRDGGHGIYQRVVENQTKSVKAFADPIIVVL